MGSDNVIPFTGATSVDIPVETILKAAQEASLSSAVLIGRTEEGDSYYATSSGDVATILLEIELFKLSLLTDTSEHLQR